MMRINQKLALATACLTIFSAVAVKPVNAIDNNISGQLIAQSSFNDRPIIDEKSDTSQNDVPSSNRQSSDDSWIMPVLWGLGGYLIGSLVGTNKTYTKMNKGR
ncbi:MAG: hypothetical protein WBF90_09385 [Rivularia sp. (in: cyanobacteria)]